MFAPLLPTTFDNDAVGKPIWSRDYLASGETDHGSQTGCDGEINPKAARHDGTLITWEDFFWQWKASNGSDKAYQIASANGYEDIESVQSGDDREVIVTFAQVLGRPSSISSIRPRPTEPRSSTKAGGTVPHHGRPIQDRHHRPHVHHVG